MNDYKTKRLPDDARLAAKCLKETNTFSTGQGILIDCAETIEALAAENARLRAAEAQAEALVEAVTFARNRLEMICDKAWNEDARDFKRRLATMFSEFDAILANRKGDGASDPKCPYNATGDECCGGYCSMATMDDPPDPRDTP